MALLPDTPPSLAAAINPDLPHHGISYPSGYIDSLPILHDRPHPFSPIRAISAAQLAQLRLADATTDPPDAVLFPYLHGLDGDNDAQNLFFTQQALIARGANASHSASMLVPPYRGLMSVVAEEGADPRAGSADWADEDEDSILDDSDDEFYDEDDLMDEDDERAHESDNTPPDTDAVPALDHTREASEESSTSGGSSPNTDSPPASVFGRSLESSATSLDQSQDGTKEPGTVQIPRPRTTSTFHSSITPFLTSSFRASDLLADPTAEAAEFIDPRIPDGISLRNFGIQMGKYTTLSDIVIYSAGGLTASALTLARRFKHAIEKKALDRHTKYPDAQLLPYNVFVCTDPFSVFERDFPYLVAVDTHGIVKHKVDFLAREKEEMRNLTRASEISPSVWLGNTADAPMPILARSADPFDPMGNPGGYDICIECHDGVPFPSASHLRQAEEHLHGLDERWAQQCAASTSPASSGRALSSPPQSPRSPVSPTTSAILELSELHFSRAKSGPPTPLSLSGRGSPADTPRVSRRSENAHHHQHHQRLRPPPNPMSAIHLLFPSSPPSTQNTLSQLMPFLEFIERAVTLDTSARHQSSSRNSSSSANSKQGAFRPSRPLKVLIYSADGYTESSFLALSWLMYHLELSLPEAYLDLQVEKHRSFFVYANEIGVLRRVETKVQEDRAAEAAAAAATASTTSVETAPAAGAREVGILGAVPGAAVGKRWRLGGQWRTRSQSSAAAAQSQSSAPHLLSSSTPSTPVESGNATPASPTGKTGKGRRPRASTSPSLPGFTDHLAWFEDPRFDGSFPSRVLPFLYLGNLNHAQNVYMLHALGITHVVSVGECALVPPQSEGGTGFNLVCPVTHSQAGRGSLWIEEREGRIKVLDIKGVCDDGIDSLRPQIRPVVDWIDKAREQGGRVLVHCRVGVSRSATITIAYVMKYLQCSLVEAYLMVRSRRLSVLIQPNMRLLYNLCGWEVELAMDRIRAGDVPEHFGIESRLSWPFLAKEVHTLNERYLS